MSFNSPLIRVIIADLDKCFAGDKSAYDRIVSVLGTMIGSDEPLNSNERFWIKETTERIAKEFKP